MGNSLEQALKRCDFGGAYAPPVCAVGRISAHFNASSASWDGLSIRRREVFKGFGRRKPDGFCKRKIGKNYRELISFYFSASA